MVAYKDEERGTWYVSFYYEDWTGAKKRKVKRGFRTKKEALNFEAERRKDCGSATHGTIRRHHSWGLLTPTSYDRIFLFYQNYNTRFSICQYLCTKNMADQP